MPNRICRECYEKLTQFYAFRLECLQSNQALRKYLDRTVLEQSVHNSGAVFTISEIKQETDDATATQDSTEDSTEDNQETFNGADGDSSDAKRRKVVENEPLPVDLVVDCYLGTAKGNEIFKCIPCNHTMSDVRATNSHLAVHQSVPRNRTCSFCHRRFITTAILRRHLAVHTGKFLIFLSHSVIKSTMFGVYSYSNSRVTSLSDARPFKCTVCGKRYKRIDDIQMHFKMHRRNEKAICKR